MATLYPLYFSSNSSTRPDIRDTVGINYRFNNGSIGSVTSVIISNGDFPYVNNWTSSLAVNDTLKISDSSNTVIATFTISSISFNNNSTNYYTAIAVTNPQGSVPSNNQLTNLFVPITANAAATLNSRFAITSDPKKLKSAQATITSAFAPTLTADVTSLGYVVKDYIDEGYFVITWLGYSDLNTATSLSAAISRFRSATVNLNSTSTVNAVAEKYKNLASDLTARVAVNASADRSRFGNTSLATRFTLDSTAKVLKSASISTTSLWTLTANLAKSTAATCDLTTRFTIVAERVVLRPAAVSLASTFTQSATAKVTKNTSLSATSAFATVITPTVTKTTSTNMSARATVSAIVIKIRQASVTMQAFDTVVSVSARIRSNPADLAVRTTLTATCIRIISASVIEPPAYAFNGNNAIISNQVGSGWSLPQGFGGGWTVAFSIRKGPDIIGKIFSSYETDNSFNIGVTDVGLYIQATNITPGLPGVRVITLDINDYTWNSDWHQVLIKINQWATPIPGGNDLDNVSSADFYVDGQLIGSRSETNTDNLATQSGAAYLNIVDPYYIGENLDAAVRQLWIGETPTNFTASDWYPGHYQDLGSVGINGYTQTLPIPLIYNQFLDSDYIRNWNTKFTLTAKGDNTVFAQVLTTARFSLSATCVRTKPATFTTAARFTVTVNAYDFTKAQASITARSTVSATSGYLRNQTATLISKVTLAVSAIKQNSGQTTASSAFNMQATSRISTLINADITARFTLEAEGRLQARIRATADLSAKLTLSVTPKVTRRVQSAVTTRVSLVAQCVVIRAGQVEMTALAFQLSAGRIIEFLRENTILVAQEQRLLLTALESTVLLVQMANGVNTITAEPRSTLVSQESGVLLAQHNMPTN